jgi:outer membrane lipoprotein-sorting protein
MKIKNTIIIMIAILLLFTVGCKSDGSTGFNKKLKNEKLIEQLQEITVDADFTVRSDVTVFGYTFDDLTYVSGDNRYTQTQDGSVNIFNADSNTSYTYIKGQETGYSSITEKQTFYDIDEIYNSEKIEAEVASYNDMDAIHIIAGDELNTERTEIWVSIDYAYPLKVDMYIGGQLFLSQVVTEIREYTEGPEIVFEDFANATVE